MKITRRDKEKSQSVALTQWRAGNPQFNNAIMAVGVVDGTIKYPDGTRLADVVFWNEYGTRKIPARPAMRRAISRTAPKLVVDGAKYANLMVNGKMRFDVAVRKLAKVLQADMKRAIESFRTPRNAPFTIAKKGFDNPLIDSRLYVDSIDYKLLRTRQDNRPTGDSQGPPA